MKLSGDTFFKRVFLNSLRKNFFINIAHTAGQKSFSVLFVSFGRSILSFLGFHDSELSFVSIEDSLLKKPSCRG